MYDRYWDMEEKRHAHCKTYPFAYRPFFQVQDYWHQSLLLKQVSEGPSLGHVYMYVESIEYTT